MLEVTDRDGSLEWVLDKLSAAKGKKPAAPKEKKKEDLTAKRVVELDLWKTWKKNKEDPKHLDPLLKSLNPLIQKHALKFKGRVEIPDAAIDFENKKEVVKALQTYDPKKGTALNTWVTTNLKKTSRFIHNTQNFARITEPIAQKIGTYHAVKADLANKLGHEPDDHTLHEALVPHGYSMKDIKRLNKEIRKGFISGQGGLDETQNALHSSLDQEVIHLIVPQLSAPERAVHEYTFGLNGKPKLAPGQIAKKLKMDNSKVAKLRTSIWKKMEPHLG